MSSSGSFESAAASCGRKLAATALLTLWLALLAALLGRYAWPFDLFTHFRLQYALLFVFAGALLLLVRRRSLAALAVLGALLSAAPAAGYLSWPASHARASAPSFRLVTFNIWFRNSMHAEVAQYLQRTAADAIVLQEISTSRARQLHQQLPSYPYAYLDAGGKGAVVFSKWPIVAAQVLRLAQDGPPAARVVLDWRGTAVTLLGVHLDWPLGSRNSRWRNAELRHIGMIAAAEPGPLLIAGDFNVTPWSSHFRDVLAQAPLSDCAAGQGLARSWPAQFAPLGIRIDHCLSSRHWRTVNVSVGPAIGSDHLPVVAELALAAHPSAEPSQSAHERRTR